MLKLKFWVNQIRQSAQRRIALIILATFIFETMAGASAVFAQGTGQKPRLVLFLIADLFSYDFLSRYQDKLPTTGLRYLMDTGANFTNCQFQQASNQTASGQAIIATGTYPWANGIVADQWYDHRKNKLVSAVNPDEGPTLVGSNGSAGSSHELNGTTIGDQIKLATNGRGKVIAVALNDKAALLMAGKLANGAFWWDTRTGCFVTSSQFGHDLPTWAKSFNEQHYADRYFGKPWQRLLPETQYIASIRDDYPHEKAFAGDGKQFPHVINGGLTAPGDKFYETFLSTPWANQMVADFAKEAIEKEALGMHMDPDFISINFSATEAVGNNFGPNSQEMQDTVCRLDQSIAALLQFVDQKIGLSNCLIVFTADHGVAPIPELLRERGLDTGRIDPIAVKAQLNAAISGRLSKDDYIEAFEPPNLYLNLNTIDRLKYRQPDIEALTAKMAHAIPGIGDVYGAAQFFLNEVPNGPLSNTVRRSYYWGRSGELVVLPKPGWVFSTDTEGTSSGSPYSYDAQVPLILYGSTVKGGRYGETCSPADIAPTVAALLGVCTPPMSEGRVLHEAMDQLYGPPRPRGVYSGVSAEK